MLRHLPGLRLPTIWLEGGGRGETAATHSFLSHRPECASVLLKKKKKKKKPLSAAHGLHTVRSQPSDSHCGVPVAAAAPGNL